MSSGHAELAISRICSFFYGLQDKISALNSKFHAGLYKLMSCSHTKEEFLIQILISDSRYLAMYLYLFLFNWLRRSASRDF